MQSHREKCNEISLVEKSLTLVYGWLNRKVPFFPYTMDECSVVHTDMPRARIDLFTETHRYRITLWPKIRKRRSYLGCQASARKPLAGEGWYRGRDLPDGPLTKGTLDRIIRAIAGFEMVSIESPIPNKQRKERILRKEGIVNKETIITKKQ